MAFFRNRRPWQSVLFRVPVDEEVDSEFELHVDLLVRDYLTRGLTPGEARRAALIRLGDVTKAKEDCRLIAQQRERDMQNAEWLLELAQDVRYGARQLWHSRSFVAVATLTLALGVGSTTAIFSLVQAVLLRPLPYHDPERLVVPATVFKEHNSDRVRVSYPDFMDWTAQTRIFEAVAIVNENAMDMTGDDVPERLRAASVSEAYFRVMGAPPFAGRTFVPQEHQKAAGKVVVLSHALWLRRFGGDMEILGTTVELDGVPHQVLGIMAPHAGWPDTVELWVPFVPAAMSADALQRRDNHAWQVVARLQPGVSVAQAQVELAAMAQRIEAANPATRRGTGWKVHRLDEWIVGQELRLTLLVLLGAVGLVLVIACANIASLLVARGAARQREIAIRSALGAGRARIVRQLLTESLVLAAIGGVAGIGVAFGLIKLLILYAPPGLPRLEGVGMNPWVLGFSLVLCLAASLMFGLMPGLHASRIAVAHSIRAGGRSIAGGLGTGRLRAILVAAELALTLVLLFGTGLLLRTVVRLHAVEPGVITQNVLAMEVSLPRRYAHPVQVASTFSEVTERLQQLPGVAAASAVGSLPLGGGGGYLGRAYIREDQPEPPASADVGGLWVVAQPGVFGTLGIRLLAGRVFEERDSGSSKPVIILSESVAKRMFGTDNPLGRNVRSWRDENLLREVVGVVSDAHYDELTEQQPAQVYVPHAQDSGNWRSMMMIVRTTDDPERLIPSIRQAIWSTDRRLTIAEVNTLDRVLQQRLARPRFSMFLLAAFAGLALLLAAVGLYGVMSYMVVQRTREIGVRMALGAQSGDVVRQVLREGGTLTLVGLLIGAAAATMLGQWAQSLLFEVDPVDPSTLFISAVFLLAVALSACWLPAQRATRVDPLIALRDQ